MTLDEVKKRLKIFDKYKFFEDGHYYECNGKRVGMSVTRLIEDYSQPFNQEEIAKKVALNQNKSVSDILNEWEYKNKFACEKGSTCHEYAQSIWSKEKYVQKQFDGSNVFINAVQKIQRQAVQFYLDNCKKLIHIKDEQLVGIEQFDIASAIDHLFYDKTKNEVVLVDYKTNSILKGYNDDEKNRKYTKNMLIPFQHLKDDSLHHYYLQLSIYKYILEEIAGIPVGQMFIVYMSENINNYEIIDIPYLKNEVKMILESREQKKMGKCVPVLIIGHSGSGKSASLRNLSSEDYSLVNPLGKRLPFKGGANGLVSCDYDEIKNFIAKTPKNIIVIDDSNYLLTMEMMKKAKETGYGKFTDIAVNYWKLIDFIKNLDGDKRVYLMSHEDIDEFGNIGVKTVGKMLSNQCCVEGLYTIVLRAESENGKFTFRTKTRGNDIVKTPMGMFEEESIENDLALVDKTICEYYEIKNN